MQLPIKNPPKPSLGFGVLGWGFFGRHAGIDYPVAKGTSVYAPGDGVVRSAIWTSGGGNLIEIEIDKYLHRFLHLDSMNVKAGQSVKEGKLIGHSGATGDVTGAHLHWDVRKKNTAWNEAYSDYIDPLKLLEETMYKGKDAEYWGKKYEAELKRSNNRRDRILAAHRALEVD